MKTRELIEALQDMDPSGELPVVVGASVAITHVECLPAYYDGPYLEVLQHPETGQYVSAALRRDGDKVSLYPTSLKELLLARPDLPVAVEAGRERDEEWVAETRAYAAEVENRVESDHFVRWVAKVVDCPFHQVGNPAMEWFRQHFVGGHHSGSTPMPEDIRARHDLSWADRRELQWARQVEARMTDAGLVLTLRESA